MTDSTRAVRQSLYADLVGAVLVVSLFATGAAVAAASVPVEGGTVLEASDDGPTVEVGETVELDSPFEYPDGNTVDLSPHAVVESEGDANVTVDALTGEWTNLTTHDVADGLTVDPLENHTVVMESDDATHLSVRSGNAESTDVTVGYGADANVTVAVSGLPANETIRVRDVVENTHVARNETGPDGTGTFTLPASADSDLSFDVHRERSAGEGPGTPSIEVATTTLDASTVEPDGSVGVDVTLANDGDGDGSHEVVLSVNDTRVDTTAVYVSAGSEQSVSFDHSFATPGEYAIAVDGEPVGTVTVAETDDATAESVERDQETATTTASTDASGESPTNGGASAPESDDSDGPIHVVAVLGLLVVVGGGLLVHRYR